MIRLGLGLLGMAVALWGCDRLPQQWPFRGTQSSVTVKLPPAKIASPGFALQDPPKAEPVANGT